MQKCFLVANKETQIANYLGHRSIIDVTEEHRSLTEINLEKIEIVDVDKFLYIYYQTDDSDLSFRSDMNALRALMASAFFHVSEVLFILVNNENPLMEDLIHSALRDAPIGRDKIEIVHHTGSLMLADVGKYISGAAAGQAANSSYRDVYIREADKEEKERYENYGSDIDSVLPVLTDMASLYSQRAGVEALSSGRVVNDPFMRPQLVTNFSKLSVSTNRTLDTFVVSGERWTGFERVCEYLIEYFTSVGQRCLVINLSGSSNVVSLLPNSSVLELMDIRNPMTPEKAIAVISGRFDQFGYILQFLQNIKGIEQYIINVSSEDFIATCNLVAQLSKDVHSAFVAHYREDSVQEFIRCGFRSTVLFLSFEKLKEDFALQAYKEYFKDMLVAQFPTEDVDYVEVYNFAMGGYRNE